jgi:hypothetical protein
MIFLCEHHLCIQEHFERAKSLRALTVALAGALGIRTKFQTKETAQVLPLT